MFCTNCGYHLANAKDNVCANCGAAISTVPANFRARQSAAPGKNFLLATGIVNIVFCSLAIFSIVLLGFMMWAILSFTGGDRSWINEIPGSAIEWGIYFGALFLLLFYDIFVSIMAVKWCKNTSKGAVIRNLVIIYIALAVLLNLGISFAFGFIYMEMLPFTVIGFVFGQTIPILLLIGAVKNKKAFDKQNNRDNFPQFGE